MSPADDSDRTNGEPTTDAFTYDGERFPDLTVAVAVAVARATDADPLELRPLYETVDPDALERLVTFRTRDGFGRLRVTFDYEGCAVVVTGDGRVRIRPRDASDE